MEKKIVQKKISDLVFADYNPRKAKMKESKELRDSLKKFGFVDPVLININPDRKNIVIGGHRRIEQWKELGNTEIPCIELNLPLEEEKELNIRLNRSAGVFDMDLLGLMFSKDKLMEIGFSESELSKIESEFESKVNKFNPSVVYTNSSDDLNRDHRIVNEATRVAVRNRFFKSPITLYEYYTISSSHNTFLNIGFNPDTYVVLDKEDLYNKIRWMRFYISELHESRSVDVIKAALVFFGSHAGAEYAEPLRLVRQVI